MLREAARHDFADLVRALITYDPLDGLAPVSPFEADEEGNTTLHLASRAKAKNVVAVLMGLINSPPPQRQDSPFPSYT